MEPDKRFANHVYIRHAEKVHKNGRSAAGYALDPGLTPKGSEEASKHVRHLFETYGAPDAIVCSPFLRTRQTAEPLTRLVEEITGSRPICICETDIGEFLGHHRSKPLDGNVHPDTLKCRPHHPERLHDFRRRIRRHLAAYTEPGLARQHVWFFTHGMVMKEVAQQCGARIARPRYLGMFVRRGTAIEYHSGCRSKPDPGNSRDASDRGNQ